MLAAIKHGLGNLVNFQGRDARRAFWYYVLFVYTVLVAVTMVVVVVPIIIRGFVTVVQQGIAAGQSGDPAAVRAATQTAIAGMMGEIMSATVWPSLIIGLVMLALLAASFVRRLHDSNLSGYWVLIPGANQLANLFLALAVMRHMMENLGQMAPGNPLAGMPAMQNSFDAASLLAWAATILVVVVGVRKSAPGPNRYGEAPFTA